MHVCTVASHYNRQLKQLLHSGIHHGIKMKVLGYGLPYQGDGHKLSYVKEYLNQLPDEDIVLFVDAYDVLFLANAQTILDTFLNKNVVCIFAAEHYMANSWPLHYLAKFYPPSPTVFKYLNSGTYMGYVGHLKKVLNDFQISNRDDQCQMALYYIHHQNEIALDYYCELFLPLVWVQDDEFILDKKNQILRCLLTGSTPCIIHGNGTNCDKQKYQHTYDILFEQIRD
jgi:hypothetical protein